MRVLPMPTIASIEKKIELLSETLPWLKELFEAYMEVSRVSADVSYSGVGWVPPADAGVLRERLMNGFPLVTPKELRLDFSAAECLAHGLFAVLQEKSGIFQYLAGKVRAGTVDIRVAFERFLELDEEYFEKGLGLADVEIEDFYFILGLSLKPQMTHLAREHKSFLKTPRWGKHYCPFCGFPPLLGVLRGEGLAGEGKISLLCALCETLWCVKGERCVSCPLGERDDGPRLVKIETDDALALCCRRCKRYFKYLKCHTVLDDLFFPLEDLATVLLDISASNRGYTRWGWGMVE